MREVVFRVDASQEIGAGHTMRCLTLADALAAAGWKCSFAVGPQTLAIVANLKEAPHEVIELSGDRIQPMQQRWPDGVDLLVIDHHDLGAAYEVACRPWAPRIFVIDDLAKRIHDCDLLLDQNLGRDESSYAGLVSPDCPVLIGPYYSLLRPQFPEIRETAIERRERLGQTRRVMISLGATDPHQMTIPIMERVTLNAPDVEMDIVIASAANHIEKVQALAKRLGENVRIHTDVQDMARLMQNVDLSIGSPGTTSWERCCLGLPTLLLVTADNQRSNVPPLEAAGAAILVGDWLQPDWDRFDDALAVLSADPERLRAMARKSFGVCDGAGTGRVIAAIDGIVP